MGSVQQLSAEEVWKRVSGAERTMAGPAPAATLPPLVGEERTSPQLVREIQVRGCRLMAGEAVTGTTGPGRRAAPRAGEGAVGLCGGLTAAQGAAAGEETAPEAAGALTSGLQMRTRTSGRPTHSRRVRGARSRARGRS